MSNLDRLLSLSGVLKSSVKGGPSSTNHLTLKQLIAVHESLLDSVLAQDPLGNKEKDSGDTFKVGGVEAIVKRCVPTEEVEKCQTILSNSSSDVSDAQDILLVIQYLLRLNKNKKDIQSSREVVILDGLKNITIPLLLCCSGSYGNLLRDAILDASFPECNGMNVDQDDDNDYSEQLQQCIDFMYSSTYKILNTTTQDASVNMNAKVINTVVEMSSRILTRILLVVDEGCISGGENITIRSRWTSMRESVLDTMQDLTMAILNAICYYGEDGSALVVNGMATTLMRPITALLLPVLFEQKANGESNGIANVNCLRRLNFLWRFICTLIDSEDEDDVDPCSTNKRKCRSFQQVADSVASGMLCALVSNIHTLPLAIPNHRKTPGVKTDGHAKIVQHPTFWAFVKKSLTSGDSVTLGTENRGMKGGGGFTSHMIDGNVSSQKKTFNPYQDEEMEDCDVDQDQLVRRRAIHVLRTVIDQEYDILQNERRSKKAKNGSDSSLELFKRVELWKKYILCFETLEIEVEAHLVDQVYPTVTELCAACVEVDPPSGCESLSLPKISWEWVASIFSRVLLSDSPTLRKLGLYRLFSGKAGISLNDEYAPEAIEQNIKSDNADTKKKAPTSAKQAKKQAKLSKKKGKGKGKVKVKAQPAPIRVMSATFVLFSIIHSYDSLSTSVGTGINVEGDDGKTSNDDLQKLLPVFLSKYTKSLFTDRQRLTELIEGMLSQRFIGATRAKNLVLIYNSILDAWSDGSTIKIPLSKDNVEGAVSGYRKLFNSGSVVFDYRQSLLLALSKVLSLSNLPKNEPPAPLSILKVLSLYPVSDEFNDLNEFDIQTKSNLRIWMDSFGDNWTSNVGAACAAAFVSGDLIPYTEGGADALIATSTNEREVGSSISKMCELANDSPSLLWPAISKGLSSISPFGQQMLPMAPKIGQRAARALILFVSGCKERILSGIGHGDLVLDKSGHMMPPPPNIELLISRAVSFTMNQLEMASICNFDENSIPANTFILLIDQLMVLKKSFPSSIIMESVLQKVLMNSIDSLLQQDTSNSEPKGCIEMVKHISTAYGVLSVGAKLNENDSPTTSQSDGQIDIVHICSSILKMDFKAPPRDSSSTLATWQVKGMRSIFQHAKWGTLMHLMPMVYKSKSIPVSTFRSLHNDVFDVVLDSVNATPASALPTLFETAVISARHSFHFIENSGEDDNDQLQYSQGMRKIIGTFFAIMKDTEQNSMRAYMLSVMCGLIFRPRLLVQEYSSLQKIKDRDGKYSVKKHAPILQAFRKFVKDAGNQKSHILKYAMGYISAGWLGDQDDMSRTGLPAIPYREDIAKLLIHKEEKYEQSSVHQEGEYFFVFQLHFIHPDSSIFAQIQSPRQVS